MRPERSRAKQAWPADKKHTLFEMNMLEEGEETSREKETEKERNTLDTLEHSSRYVRLFN